MATVFALSLGATLAYGFMPTAERLALWVWQGVSRPYMDLRWRGFVERVSFPALALFFLVSLRSRPATPDPKYPLGRLFKLSVLPCLIAFGFGILTRGDDPSIDLNEATWICLFSALGEEFLFRGWVYEISERIWPNRMFTLTNPFPTSLWASSFTFALWHLQNLEGQTVMFVLFQIFYTFWAGFWLGFLRWKSGSLAPAILGHFAINSLSYFAQSL